jgi:Spy/CpxP family protein refolding chaperone
MFRVSALMGVAFLAIALLVGASASQDKKDKDKTKGFTPPGMKNIGLSADQKQKISDVHAKYQDKIKNLEKEIADLKSQRQGDYFKILTKDQQEAYLKALTGETKTGGKDKEKN